MTIMAQRIASTLVKILPRQLARCSSTMATGGPVKFRGTPSTSFRLARHCPSGLVCPDRYASIRLLSSDGDQLEKDFQMAVANLQKVSGDLDNEKKLKLYALYKQGTAGECSEGKPSVFNPADKFKWQAWKALGDMSKEEAKKQYIAVVKVLLDATPGAAAEKEPDILFEKRDQVYWIRLNRPKQYNAINMDMYEGFVEALKRAAEDPEVKFAVMTGNGPYYSSGNDLKNFMKVAEQFEGRIDEALQFSRDRCQQFVAAFIDFPKPLIGVVNGPAFGIMFTTLGLFDCVVASDTAYFICPFSSLGQSPEGCSTYTFPKIFGNSLTSELLYLNYKMPVEEAHRLGFVSRIIPAGQLESHVNEWLYGPKGLVETCYPNSMFNAKNLVRNEEERLKLHAINKVECDVLQQSWTSEECQEALQRFYSRK